MHERVDLAHLSQEPDESPASGHAMPPKINPLDPENGFDLGGCWVGPVHPRTWRPSALMLVSLASDPNPKPRTQITEKGPSNLKPKPSTLSPEPDTVTDRARCVVLEPAVDALDVELMQAGSAARAAAVSTCTLGAAAVSTCHWGQRSRLARSNTAASRRAGFPI